MAEDGTGGSRETSFSNPSVIVDDLVSDEAVQALVYVIKDQTEHKNSENNNKQLADADKNSLDSIIPGHSDIQQNVFVDVDAKSSQSSLTGENLVICFQNGSIQKSEIAQGSHGSGYSGDLPEAVETTGHEEEGDPQGIQSIRRQIRSLIDPLLPSSAYVAQGRQFSVTRTPKTVHVHHLGQKYAVPTVEDHLCIQQAIDAGMSKILNGFSHYVKTAGSLSCRSLSQKPQNANMPSVWS
ncbi:hypothetical protein PoB_000421000 [Plakobranchus ocellatus]|uniref:Late endosomal/lysosomal adaptor and MAPK and MTOR activator 1 n=1 Tax=Plakobranchus ocellatus TaxID=259542 RepID=A0AAV3Y3U2_9GAST|nr:hypothetical protein PoB_000421000 [Plakobranchus ocellatus]